MHTSLRHYAVTVERSARDERAAPRILTPNRARRARRSLRIPSVAQAAGRRPAFGV